ncbi:hypothetical protein E2C01_093450 [Portunus trituberculatus]|uniref:Secreted protein n=1 Tax=Portunus trituberculatus TaxID=210409 RepID=A0A5B7JYT0_PORTR|nr:hypothetical protein [Portunus trituberculatus]
MKDFRSCCLTFLCIPLHLIVFSSYSSSYAPACSFFTHPQEVLERSTPLTHHAYMAPAPAWNTTASYDSILHTASGETYRRIEPGKDC